MKFQCLEGRSKKSNFECVLIPVSRTSLKPFTQDEQDMYDFLQELLDGPDEKKKYRKEICRKEEQSSNLESRNIGKMDENIFNNLETENSADRSNSLHVTEINSTEKKRSGKNDLLSQLKKAPQRRSDRLKRLL